MGKKKKYDYMIKTIYIDFRGYGGFRYPMEKGALVTAPDWDPKPIRGGGIHGMVSWTKGHFIQNNGIWMILKFIRSEAVVIDDEKVKVPRAWIVDWGTAEEMQRKWEKLTGVKYEFDYAVQTDGYKSIQKASNESVQTAKSGSIQIAGEHSKQNAEAESIQIADFESEQVAEQEAIQIADVYANQKAWKYSVQIARDESVQNARHESIQSAGRRSTQNAGYGCVQVAKKYSSQTAEAQSVQIAEKWCAQDAGNISVQIAGYESIQKAGAGSISIIRGQKGFCQHKGKVLQILTFWDSQAGEYVFLSKIINDNKKHELWASKEDGKWVLEDRIIEEDQND